MTLATWAAALALAAVSLAAYARKGAHAGWFHPLSLPFAALAVMSLAAPLWVHVTHRPAGLLYDPGYPPSSPSLLAVPVSATAIGALVLVLAGYAGGTVLALTFTTSVPDRPGPAFRGHAMRRSGFRLMVLAAGMRVGAGILTRGHPYGAGQVKYGAPAALAAASEALLLPGLILVTLTASRTDTPQRLRDLLRVREWAALIVCLAAVVVSGERAGLIAPAVYLAWVYSTQVRTIRLRWITVAILVALAGGAVISVYRAGQGLAVPSPAAIAADGAGDVSSAPWLTEQTVIHVPAVAPFLHGSTYVAAAESQIPGALARRAGTTGRTASAVFRDLIGFSNPDQGFSEAYPAEAYLNFGLAGCAGAGLFLGALMGWAWRRHRVVASRPRDLLYPVLLAGLVYGFRSDALTQVKDILYPVLIVGIVMAWHRQRVGVRSVQPAAFQTKRGAASP